jgi:hypothetical protein
MLHSRKALFFGSSDEDSILQQRRRGIMVVTGDTENVHRLLPLSPQQVAGFSKTVKPLSGSTFQPQGI